MFTWVCPKCGGSVDVAEVTCPHCAARGAAPEPATRHSPVPAGDETQAVQAPQAEPPASPDPQAASDPAVPVAAEPTQTAAEPIQTPVEPIQAPAARRESRPRGAFALQTKHLLWFGAAVALAVCVAVVVSTGPGGLFSALRLEDPAEMAVSPVETFAIGVRGPIEISGIRPYYDDDFQTHVRAFVANHSREAQSVAVQVLLRVREASSQAPPLATFEVVISDPLPPHGGKEVDVGLAAMGSLQSLPPWDEIRVDIEVLAASGG
ncbi:MAG: hypothetical protein OXJ37_06805 [Bryobacterales bacterium]|nr:hypothetical protein [Bryobacterales bacterium]MDE0262095.1 hypothetical protein [Bryobacterales bacterium]